MTQLDCFGLGEAGVGGVEVVVNSVGGRQWHVHPDDTRERGARHPRLPARHRRRD